MKKSKLIIGLVVGMLLVGSTKIPIYAENLSICSVQDASCRLQIRLEDGKAICSLRVYGVRGTKKISGNLSLYDNTDKKTISTWNISSQQQICNATKQSKVKKGHTYSLTFNGYLQDKDGNKENIKKTIVKR